VDAAGRAEDHNSRRRKKHRGILMFTSDVFDMAL
jgi:hypothetical protein